jgi:V/A-type H+-transporting ATPase subunit D
MLKNYKLNKSELTRLKQEIKIYQHFLPVLKLKQEQLQIEQLKVKKQYQYISEQYSITKKKISPQFALFTDTANPYSIPEILTPQKITLATKSVAGITIPIIKNVLFPALFINFFDAPCWLPLIIDDIKKFILQYVEILIAKKQYMVINKELKKATQKVNLFEKILIPDTKHAIKKINIFLGDEQVASVVRAKIAKNKCTN